jgi:hypothetical protein
MSTIDLRSYVDKYGKPYIDQKIKKQIGVVQQDEFATVRDAYDAGNSKFKVQGALKEMPPHNAFEINTKFFNDKAIPNSKPQPWVYKIDFNKSDPRANSSMYPQQSWIPTTIVEKANNVFKDGVPKYPTGGDMLRLSTLTNDQKKNVKSSLSNPDIVRRNELLQELINSGGNLFNTREQTNLENIYREYNEEINDAMSDVAMSDDSISDDGGERRRQQVKSFYEKREKEAIEYYEKMYRYQQERQQKIQELKDKWISTMEQIMMSREEINQKYEEVKNKFKKFMSEKAREKLRPIMENLEKKRQEFSPNLQSLREKVRLVNIELNLYKINSDINERFQKFYNESFILTVQFSPYEIAKESGDWDWDGGYGTNGIDKYEKVVVEAYKIITDLLERYEDTGRFDHFLDFIIQNDKLYELPLILMGNIDLEFRINDNFNKIFPYAILIYLIKKFSHDNPAGFKPTSDQLRNFLFDNPDDWKIKELSDDDMKKYESAVDKEKIYKIDADGNKLEIPQRVGWDLYSFDKLKEFRTKLDEMIMIADNPKPYEEDRNITNLIYEYFNIDDKYKDSYRMIPVFWPEIGLLE